MFLGWNKGQTSERLSSLANIGACLAEIESKEVKSSDTKPGEFLWIISQYMILLTNMEAWKL